MKSYRKFWLKKDIYWFKTKDLRLIGSLQITQFFQPAVNLLTLIQSLLDKLGKYICENADVCRRMNN